VAVSDAIATTGYDLAVAKAGKLAENYDELWQSGSPDLNRPLSVL